MKKRKINRLSKKILVLTYDLNCGLIEDLANRFLIQFRNNKNCEVTVNDNIVTIKTDLNTIKKMSNLNEDLHRDYLSESLYKHITSSMHICMFEDFDFKFIREF